MDKNKSVEFTVDGQTYMFWSWKGDYMNLGTGAETGIYKKYSDTHWLTATEKSTDMELNLYNYKNNSTIVDFKPSEEKDEPYGGKQWWITGFNPKYQNAKAEDLYSTTVIDFNNMENGEEMYEAFKEATKADRRKKTQWTFTDDKKAIWKW